MELKERENRILDFVVRDYIRRASPVSSERIRRGLKLKESGATVRNIVADLDEGGFLEQPHTSAGRVPTDRAYRYFVDNLMQDIEVEEAKLLNNLAKKEDLAEAARLFSENIHLFSIFQVENREPMTYGLSRLFMEPEFQSSGALARFGRMFDHLEEFLDIYRDAAEDDYQIFIGKENPIKEAEHCGVFHLFVKRPQRFNILFIGPKRLDYERASALIDCLLNRI